MVCFPTSVSLGLLFIQIFCLIDFFNFLNAVLENKIYITVLNETPMKLSLIENKLNKYAENKILIL